MSNSIPFAATLTCLIIGGSGAVMLALTVTAIWAHVALWRPWTLAHVAQVALAFALACALLWVGGAGWALFH